MRQLAKKLKVDKKIIRSNVARMGLKSYVRHGQQLLTSTSKRSRLDRGK